MDFCWKKKILSQLSATSVKLTFNFEHLEKKPEPHDACSSQIIDRE